MPIAASTEQAGREARPPAPRVTVNRTVPSVTAPPLTPRFSAMPTDAEITLGRVFAEPLLPVGSTTPEENRALAAAITSYLRTGRAEDAFLLEAFLATHPRTAWRPSLLAGLGSVYVAGGYLSRALEAWDQAWQLTKDSAAGTGKSVADFALGEWLDLRTRLGHVDEAETRLGEITGRILLGPVTAKVRLARDRVAMMRDEAAHLTSPGVFALAAVVDPAGRVPQKDWQRARRTEQGRRSSLVTLRRMAAGLRVPLTLARAQRGAPLVAPAIVQWRAGHVGAVVRQEGDRVFVRDAQTWSGRWIHRRALEDESSGLYLVASDRLVSGWTRVAAAVAAQAGWASTCPPGAPDTDDPCNDPSCAAGCGGPTGLATYTIHPVTAGLRLHDVPVGYSPPRGPSPSFAVRYNQDDQRQPQTFFYANLGPKWTFGWVSFVIELTTGDAVDVYLRGSGRESYDMRDVAGVYPRHWRSRAQLVRTSVDPNRYERRLPDGSVEVFTQADGPPHIGRRIFLTDVTDPHGQSLHLTWDASLRIVAATDALGQVTTLAYEHATDPLKITKVTDPFGRFASLGYDDLGRLVSITDVIGLTSSFGYDRDDLIGSLTTPYGTTTFRRESTTEAPWTRWLEATDPLGGVERVEYRYSAMPGVPAASPTAEVPAGVFVSNQDLNRFNTYYWTKRAMALYPGDVSKAVVTHWLFGNSGRATDPLPAVSVPHSVKRPLEGRIWYRYQGQVETISGAQVVGQGTEPAVTARVLDDGTTQIERATFNDLGQVASRTDPLGRRTSYMYATNGMDLLEVRQTTGSLNDLLVSFANYTPGHLPQTMTDAAGQATTLTYNSQGQVLTVTNAKSETTTFAYDAAGQGLLQTVTGPAAGATTTYTHDGYKRVRTVTASDGFAVTLDYDLFDRPTRITYPDSSHEETVYDKLDAVRQRDRRGRWSYMSYDPLRRLTAMRDPAGQTVRQLWCPCGSLDAVVDAKGQKTSWARDVQGRMTQESRADGPTTTTYTYETTTSRPRTVTDPKQQVTTYTYATDGAVLGIAHTNVQVATPSVSYSYDPNYKRVTSRFEGSGTATFGYHPVGTLGAGQIATVDGPLANDVIAYAYDELGRIAQRTINGSANTLSVAYDSLGRITSETNVLGAFTFGYDSVTSRLTSLTYPNGQSSTFAYFPNAQHRRLQTIHHKRPGGATLSKFDYTYDGVGNILTWQQQADSDPAVVWEYGYDPADQLTRAVKKTTGGMPTVLKRYAYGYDLAGNRTYEQIDDAVTGWTHDSLNRLATQLGGGSLRFAGTLNEPATVTIQGQPAAVSGTNAFERTVPVVAGTNSVTLVATDSSGNVRTAAFEVDVAASNKTFIYDGNGNLVTDGTRTFEWDARNRLTAVVVGTHRSEFTYDGLHRRVRIVEKESSVTTRDAHFIWAGGRIVEERLSTGEVNRFFVTGEQHSGAAQFLTKDHLGSVREVTDTSGAIVTRNDYDPYGRVTRVAGTVDSRFGYTGHIAHPWSGLALAQYRANDPGLGR